MRASLHMCTQSSRTAHLYHSIDGDGWRGGTSLLLPVSLQIETYQLWIDSVAVCACTCAHRVWGNALGAWLCQILLSLVFHQPLRDSEGTVRAKGGGLFPSTLFVLCCRLAAQRQGGRRQQIFFCRHIWSPLRVSVAILWPRLVTT